MSLANLNTPNIDTVFSNNNYVNNLDSVDFSGRLNVGVAKAGSIYIGGSSTPVYIDNVLYNPNSLPITNTKVSLSASQLNHLHTTPITLVAGVAGYFINVLNVACWLTYNGSAYDGGAIQVGNSPLTSNDNVYYSDGANVLFTLTSNATFSLQFNNSTPHALFGNNSPVLINSASNGSTGTSTAVIYVSYVLIPV